MNNTLIELTKIIDRRQLENAESSYTASLLHGGIEKCCEKFGEETIELIVASLSKPKDEFTHEAADVLYHLLVLLKAKNVSLTEVLQILSDRMNISGHEEKRLRSKD